MSLGMHEWVVCGTVLAAHQHTELWVQAGPASSSHCPAHPIQPDKAGMTREGLMWQLYSMAPMALACMTFQLVLKRGLWEGMVRRQGGEHFVSNSRS